MSGVNVDNTTTTLNLTAAVFIEEEEDDNLAKAKEYVAIGFATLVLMLSMGVCVVLLLLQLRTRGQKIQPSKTSIQQAQINDEQCQNAHAHPQNKEYDAHQDQSGAACSENADATNGQQQRSVEWKLSEFSEDELSAAGEEEIANCLRDAIEDPQPWEHQDPCVLAYSNGKDIDLPPWPVTIASAEPAELSRTTRSNNSTRAICQQASPLAMREEAPSQQDSRLTSPSITILSSSPRNSNGSLQPRATSHKVEVDVAQGASPNSLKSTTKIAEESAVTETPPSTCATISNDDGGGFVAAADGAVFADEEVEADVTNQASSTPWNVNVHEAHVPGFRQSDGSETDEDSEGGC